MADTKTKKISPVVIEGLEINGQNVSFSKLQEFSLTLFEKLVAHRKQRNWLLLERDKLRTILENTRHEIRLADDTVLNKEEELERAQERFREELREVDQQRKFLEYDLGKNVEEVQMWETSAMGKTKDKNLLEELGLLQEKRQLKEELLKEMNKCDEEFGYLKLKHLDELASLQQECFEVQSGKEIEFKKSFNQAIEQLHLKHDMEMSELEERKNIHLNELKKIHITRTNETKEFFNSVTSENLTVIANLRQSLSNIKVSNVDLTAKVKFLKADNEGLREPLAISESNVTTLKKHVVNYEKDLLSLKNNKWMLKNTIDQAKQIRKENVIAIMKLNNCEVKEYEETFEYDCLHSMKDFTASMTFKKDRLGKVIDYLLEELKKKQKKIQELTVDFGISRALSEMKFEMWSPKQLSYELAIVCKAHDELLSVLQEKLEEFCVPEIDLGSTAIAMKYTGLNPAGLVSKQY